MVVYGCQQLAQINKRLSDVYLKACLIPVRQSCTNLYSKCPPVTLTYACRRLHHCLTAVLIMRWSCSSHTFTIHSCSSSMSLIRCLLTCFCIPDQIFQSTRFRSGLSAATQMVYEVRSLLCQQFQHITCTVHTCMVHWRTVLLKCIKVRQLMNLHRDAENLINVACIGIAKLLNARGSVFLITYVHFDRGHWVRLVFMLNLLSERRVLKRLWHVSAWVHLKFVFLLDFRRVHIIVKFEIRVWMKVYIMFLRLFLHFCGIKQV